MAIYLVNNDSTSEPNKSINESGGAHQKLLNITKKKTYNGVNLKKVKKAIENSKKNPNTLESDDNLVKSLKKRLGVGDITKDERVKRGQKKIKGEKKDKPLIKFYQDDSRNESTIEGSEKSLYERIQEAKIGNDLEVIQEAKFRILPMFTENEELKKYRGDVEEAIKLCNEHDIKTNADAEEFARKLNRITQIVFDGCDAMAIPRIAVSIVNPLIFLINIALYMVDRLIEWCTRHNQEKMVKATATKALVSVNMALKKVKDKKVKDKLLTLKNKLEKGIDKDYD